MRVAVIRHVAFEDVGYLGPILRSRGHTLQYSEIGEPVELQRAGALVLMGGPMSVNDASPWVSAELRTIEAALRRSIPILGICLGAQLIARSLGAAVYPNREKEIGWFPVRWRPEAASDSLFGALSHPETLFHWHGETFSLPPESVWLAESDGCPHQAFRYGENVYALQFHAEVTAAMIDDWCIQDAACGDARELAGPIESRQYIDRQREVAELIFGRWAGKFLAGATFLPDASR
jgi:GMP synthase-like glutamine amidotransferase